MVDIQVNNLTKFFVIGENLLDGLSFEVQEEVLPYWAEMDVERPRCLTF